MSIYQAILDWNAAIKIAIAKANARGDKEWADFLRSQLF